MHTQCNWCKIYSTWNKWVTFTGTFTAILKINPNVGQNLLIILPKIEFSLKFGMFILVNVSEFISSGLNSTPILLSMCIFQKPTPNVQRFFFKEMGMADANN